VDGHILRCCVRLLFVPLEWFVAKALFSAVCFFKTSYTMFSSRVVKVNAFRASQEQQHRIYLTPNVFPAFKMPLCASR